MEKQVQRTMTRSIIQEALTSNGRAKSSVFLDSIATARTPPGCQTAQRLAFRYMNRQWAWKLVREGEILLRRLSYYSQEENKGRPIYDENEGRSTLRVSRLSYDFKDKSGILTDDSGSHFLSADDAGRLGIGNMFGDFQGIHIINGGLSASLPAAWVLCSCDTYSRAIMRSFHTDTAVKILDIYQFAALLRRSLMRMGGAEARAPLLVGKVRYDDAIPVASRDGPDFASMAFTKRRKYYREREVRILVPCAPGCPEDVVVKSEEIAQLCSIV